MVGMQIDLGIFGMQHLILCFIAPRSIPHPPPQPQQPLSQQLFPQPLLQPQEGAQLLPQPLLQPQEGAQLLPQPLLQPQEGAQLLPQPLLQPQEGAQLLPQPLLQPQEGAQPLPQPLLQPQEGAQLLPQPLSQHPPQPPLSKPNNEGRLEQHEGVEQHVGVEQQEGAAAQHPVSQHPLAPSIEFNKSNPKLCEQKATLITRVAARMFHFIETLLLIYDEL